MTRDSSSFGAHMQSRPHASERLVVIPAGAVAIVDGTIRETGPFAAIAPKYPGAGVIGDGTQLLMPGWWTLIAMARPIADPEKVCATTFSRTLCSTGRTCPSYHRS